MISAWWNLTGTELKKSSQNLTGKLEKTATPKQVWILLIYGSPSRNGRIKMKKSIDHVVAWCSEFCKKRPSCVP